MMGGPNFETPAELRLMRLQGVDAVGISKISFKTYFKIGDPGSYVPKIIITKSVG